MTKKNTQGFTLIELLVVIAIIALLSSIVIFESIQTTADAQNAKVSIDVHSVATALELYYDNNGYYPPSPNCLGTSCDAHWTSLPGGGWDTLAADLQKYIDLPYPSYTTDANRKYNYVTGSPTNPEEIEVTNSVGGACITNVIIDGGYYLDFELPAPQNYESLNDGGVDPDGVEAFGGNYSFSPCTEAQGG